MSRRDDEDSADVPPVEWHNRTSTLLAVSVAGIAAIALLIVVISYMARQFSEPEPAPLYYVPPTDSSASATRSATATTTATITSTSPPVTSDINPGETLTTSESTRPSTRPPRTRETDDEDESRTTRSRPRTNVTRTLYPGA